MDYENRWDALLKPGLATEYFDVHGQKVFEADATSYSKVNAWWLAELSRLIYRRESDEVGDDRRRPTRNQILNEVGLNEIEFFNEGGTQCAIVGPSIRTGAGFLVLVFRGTTNFQAWVDNLNALLEPWPMGGSVHQGFREALDRVWKKIARRLSRFKCPTFYTGHSLGAALATLAASRRPPRAVYTFGSPRVGDQGFASALPERAVFRVVNHRDVVTTVPPSLLGFCHVGELYYIAHDGHILVDPPEGAVVADRLREDPTFNIRSSWKDRLVGPAQFLTDHAPFNYVAHLERELSSRA